jgi:hypothetical protein
MLYDLASLSFNNVRYERSKVLSLIRKPNRPTTQYGKRRASGSLCGVKHQIPMSFLNDVAAKVDGRFRNVPHASVVDGYSGLSSEVTFGESLFRVSP